MKELQKPHIQWHKN